MPSLIPPRTSGLLSRLASTDGPGRRSGGRPGRRPATLGHQIWGTWTFRGSHGEETLRRAVGSESHTTAISKSADMLSHGSTLPSAKQLICFLFSSCHEFAPVKPVVLLQGKGCLFGEWLALLWRGSHIRRLAPEEGVKGREPLTTTPQAPPLRHPTHVINRYVLVLCHGFSCRKCRRHR